MSTYRIAPPELIAQVQTIMREYEAELDAVGIRVDTLLAFADRNDQGEKTGPAIKAKGYPADGCIRSTNLKDRVKGLGDAEMILDGDKWQEMNSEEQDALIHHELHHLVPARKADGELILDSHNRPKIRMRLHDIELGMFIDVARAHGMASGEVQAMQMLVASNGQVLLPFLTQETGNGEVLTIDAPSSVAKDIARMKRAKKA